MNFYFAPMEGLTGFVYRNSFQTCFGTIDKYFSPFIVPNQKGKLRSRELNDILPQHNKGITLIPQILTNQAEGFLQISKELKDIGYDEVNLNLGCPSGTVVSKNRGAGFLAKPEELDAFLEEIFAASLTRISIKTRLGLKEPEEFYQLLELYNKYPLEELIIHPRVREDYYKNKPHQQMFQEAMKLSKNKISYNGDIFTRENYQELTNNYPELESVMLGRGLLRNPDLINEINGKKKLTKELLKEFHEIIYEGYQSILSGDINVLFKMKELWFYMIAVFDEHEKYAKKIKKVGKLADYERIIAAMFQELELKR